MRVAFVGMGRDRMTIPSGYLYNFVRYHLELPFYYAQHHSIDVTLTFPGHLHYNPVHEQELDQFEDRDDCSKLWLSSEAEFVKLEQKFDVVIHWRKWHEHLYRPEAKNVILSQDHSYGQQWLFDTSKANTNGKLHGILVFPTWHRENMEAELRSLGDINLIEGLTLGVDTSIYYRSVERNPYRLLWAADPGRGLDQFIYTAAILHGLDRRFEAHVTWPDYVNSKVVKDQYSLFFKEPWATCHGQIPNDENLWALFRSCGVLPYTSRFKEPSSRCHRQAMACGALVLYPPDMGTPSRLIEHERTGIVEPAVAWPRRILELVNSGRWREIGDRAAWYADLESWKVQADRFYEHFREQG